MNPWADRFMDTLTSKSMIDQPAAIPTRLRFIMCFLISTKNKWAQPWARSWNLCRTSQRWASLYLSWNPTSWIVAYVRWWWTCYINWLQPSKLSVHHQSSSQLRKLTLWSYHPVTSPPIKPKVRCVVGVLPARIRVDSQAATYLEAAAGNSPRPPQNDSIRAVRKVRHFHHGACYSFLMVVHHGFWGVPQI